MPEGAAKVDRSTRYGNPFEVRGPKRGGLRRFRVERDGIVYKTSLTYREAADHAVLRFACEVAPLLDLSPLRGRNLGCWCREGQPCHADTLIDLANRD